MIAKPKIRKALLPINMFSRPGRKLVSIKGIVLHWTGNAVNDDGFGDADHHITYFKSLATQDPHDDEKDRYAGAHYFVGVEGDIIQLIPDNEIAYHVGAHKYNEQILDKFNTTYPNNCLIGIELTHPEWDGVFTDDTWNSAVHLVTWLLEEYDLTLSDVVRHYDVTGKLCPKWFVEDEEAYSRFMNDVMEMMNESALYGKKVRGFCK